MLRQRFTTVALVAPLAVLLRRDRPGRGPDSAGARAGAAAEIRLDQGFLRRLHSHLPGRRPQKAADRARARSGQEARQDAVGLHGAGAEAVRLGRHEDLFLHPGGQAGHRQPGAHRCRGDDPGAVSHGKRPPDNATSRLPSSNCPPGLPAGSRALKLLPKSRQPDYDWLVLAVDPATLVIRGLMTVDAQGGTSTFSFTNMKENVGLADNQFVFKIPRGVDVVTEPVPSLNAVPPRDRLSRLSLWSCCRRSSAACATSAAFRRGRDAEQRQDYDRAVAEYSQVLRLSPDNTDARLGLERARMRASQDHFVKGRRLAALGKFDEALVEYGLAAELNPTQRGHRPGTAIDAQQPARENRRVERRQDRAPDADRSLQHAGTAWPGPSRGRQDAGVAHVPRGEQP